MRHFQHVQGDSFVGDVVTAEDLIGSVISVTDTGRATDMKTTPKTTKGWMRMFLGLLDKRKKLPVETPSPEEIQQGMREAQLFQNLSILNKVENQGSDNVNPLSDEDSIFLDFIRNMGKEELQKVRLAILSELKR
jgi:hypothetical protein